MTDIILAAGGAHARDLSPVTIMARGSPAPEPSGSVPRQEWLAKASTGNSPSIRLVGHKVLALGTGRSPRPPTGSDVASSDVASSDVTSSNGTSYAARAIAVFSQQLGSYASAKGTRIDTYA